MTQPASKLVNTIFSISDQTRNAVTFLRVISCEARGSFF